MAQNWLGNIEQFPSDYADIYQSVNVDPDQIHVAWVQKLCKDKKNLGAYFADPTTSLAWICFAASYNGLPNSLAFRVQIDLPKDGGVIRQALRYWQVAELLATLEENPEGDKRPIEQRVYSMFVNATVLEYCVRNMHLKPANSSVLFAPIASTGQPTRRGIQDHVCPDNSLEFGHPIGAKVSISWLDLKFNATAITNKYQAEVPLALARASKSFRLGMERIQKMRDLVPTDLRKSIFVEDRVELKPTLQTLRAFLRVGRLVSELRARWYLWPADPELSGAERLRALDLGGLLRLALEEAEPAPSNRRNPESVNNALEGRVGLALRRILDLAFRADRRELAVEGIRLALGLEKRSESPPYETFFLSLAGYLLDEADGDSVTVTKESFRAAAKDLLRTLPSEGVPTAGERVRFRAFPLLSTRISFHDDYRNESGRTGRRTTVAADWPVGYLAISDYLGMRVSAFDLIGPLGELALREVGEWHDEKLVLLDFLRPKVGVWLAVPQLSRRLILDAGIGVRFIGTQEVDGEVAGRYERKAGPEIHFGLSYVL
jgi:hypothetical protein